MRIELKDLKNLINTLDEEGVGEFEYQDDQYRVRLVLASQAPPRVAYRAAPSGAAAPVPEGDGAAEPDEERGISYVTSPFVGTFYRAPNPDTDPFVEVGATVEQGQTLCIVEAMKLMNEIESEYAGRVVEVLVDNGESVEFGQQLFKLQTG